MILLCLFLSESAVKQTHPLIYSSTHNTEYKYLKIVS